MFEYTTKEKNEVLEKYFVSKESLMIHVFPKKQKQKYLCLLWIKSLFEKDKYYTEKEINDLLKNIHQDYVMIRRYLVDFGLLYRKEDGSKYWI
ncbi:DUF2087 domain-containing protein [Mycoplasmatota bacterium]|nr:DUF2087 domain-containing protein [Mycoplasmatota bacterium]